MSTYSEIDAYSEVGQRSKMERFGKIIIAFNYFWKKLNQRGFWVLNMSEF